MFEQYPEQLPSDGSLRYELVRNRGFTESGASDFLSQLRATIAYAKLDETGTVDGDGSDESPDPEGADDDHQDEKKDRGQQGRQKPPKDQRERRPGVVSISLPLPAFGPDEPVVIEFPGKLPEQDWDFFLTLVMAMKAGVVETASDREPPPPDKD